MRQRIALLLPFLGVSSLDLGCLQPRAALFFALITGPYEYFTQIGLAICALQYYYIAMR